MKKKTKAGVNVLSSTKGNEIPTRSQVLQAMREGEKELSEVFMRTGHYKRARRILLDSGKYSPECIACMTDEQVLLCVQLDYMYVGIADCTGDDILLVRREKAQDFEDLATWICR